MGSPGQQQQCRRAAGLPPWDDADQCFSTVTYLQGHSGPMMEEAVGEVTQVQKDDVC